MSESEISYANPSCYVIIAISVGIYFVRVHFLANVIEVLVNQHLGNPKSTGLSTFVDENR